jgi:hypothetical protein
VLIALRTPALARFDEQVPDAAPDDLIGFEARQRRTSAAEPERSADQLVPYQESALKRKILAKY